MPTCRRRCLLPAGSLGLGVLLAALVGGAPAGLAAQEPAPVRADSARPAGPDSAAVPRPPVSPMGAFFRSLLLPGWGQARLDRKLTGALFVAWEGVTLGMALKTSHELHYLRRTNSARVESKKQERQDWLVLLAFNHLLSGLEAYVSAHLWDFPGDLDLRVLPGGVGAGVSLPLR